MSDEEIILDIKLMDMLKNPPKSLMCEEFSLKDDSMVQFNDIPEEDRVVDTSSLKELDEMLDNLQ